MAELATWLEDRGLGQYADVMAANDVDLDVLSHLSDDDLKELGLSLGHRRILLTALRDQATDETHTSHDPDHQAERRQLTVMFCDLVGSTELSEQLDPEELRAVMGRYHDAVAASVSAHEGHVAKLLGDGVLAYFGWPQAHEDDAERSILAALAALSAVGKIEAAVGPMSARAGIATGPVVVGDMVGAVSQERGAVSGATPNLAARLQGLAKPGQVVIHAATRRLVGASFNLEDAGTHRLKGFGDPVEAWRVTSAARRSSRFEAQRGSGLTDFTGRAQEIGLLRERWDQARHGEGQLVLLSGEAGIGKSRISREFVLGLDADACCVLRFQCSPHEVNAAFQPALAEIETTAGLLATQSPEQRLDKLEKHLSAVFSSRDEAAALIAPLLGLPADRYQPLEIGPQRRKQRIVELLTERILRMAEDRPVVALIEDIHWIDPSSLEMLDMLVERLEVMPVLAIVTHRHDFASRWGEFGHVSDISLSRLGREDGRVIAERVAGGKALPAEVLDRIVAQTDGIPLFAEELTKTVLEAGILHEEADRYVLNGPLPALAIPETLQDSLMARLDRLAPVKRVVQAAACIGREFEAGLLANAVAMGATDLDNALDQLLAAELIFRRGGSAEARYIFKHALVQDAAYASLLTPARRALHERLALAMEQTDSPDTLQLARHYFEAGMNARASELYLAAGRRMLETSAGPEAIGALENAFRAMEAIPPSAGRDRLELDIRVTLGGARMAILGWQHPSVLEVFHPALPLAKAMRDPAALCSTLWGLGSYYCTRGEIARTHDLIVEEWPGVLEIGDPIIKPIYHMAAADVFMWMGDYECSIQHTESVKRLYRRDLHAPITAITAHNPLCHAQNLAGSLCDWIRGYPESAVARMDEAVAHAREIGHPFNLVFTLTPGSTCLIYLGRTEQLLAHCEEAENIVKEEALGVFAEQVFVGQWRGAALIASGNFGAGFPMAKQGNDFWCGADGRLGGALMRSWMVDGLQGLGRIDEALALSESNIAHCRDTGDRYMEPECIRQTGELVLADKPLDVETVERTFRNAVAIAAADKAKSWELRAAMSLARLLRDQDRRAEAIGCLEPILNWFREGLGTADLVEARALLSSLD
jgi:class 3 adenylate cyclase/tetratricopeptide (TPR) repeat protein